jgi:hypothetical protein
MSRKIEKSSCELVSTEREGGSILWPVKGTDVSIVNGVVLVEIRRLKIGVITAAARLDDRDEEERRDRAILDRLILT